MRHRDGSKRCSYSAGKVAAQSAWRTTRGSDCRRCAGVQCAARASLQTQGKIEKAPRPSLIGGMLMSALTIMGNVPRAGIWYGIPTYSFMDFFLLSRPESFLERLCRDKDENDSAFTSAPRRISAHTVGRTRCRCSRRSCPCCRPQGRARL